MERTGRGGGLTRRRFLVAAAAAGAVRAAPAGLARLPVAPAKRVLELVYDRALGAMRAVDRVVN